MGPCFQHTIWFGPEICIWTEGWLAPCSVVLRAQAGGRWYATRPAPCPGQPRLVLRICGDHPGIWSMDRWHGASRNAAHGHLYIAARSMEWDDLLAPLSVEERSKLMLKQKNTGPGPSFWKISFLPLFPAWSQEAYWSSTDIQRCTAMVSEDAKFVIQCNLLKENGGFRPLSMLEESLKVIEGPVARRRISCRSAHPDGHVYSATNLVSVAGRHATTEVLYILMHSFVKMLLSTAGL